MDLITRQIQALQ